MRYAVVQTSLDAPPKEALGAAFSQLAELTAADIRIIGDDAFGVLVNNFSKESAQRLCSALQAQGVETVVLPQEELPEMPPRKIIRQLGFEAEGLRVHDSIGRPLLIEWSHIYLLAAGSVKEIKPSTESRRTAVNRSIGRLPVTLHRSDHYSREAREAVFRLEIVLSHGVQSISLEFGHAPELIFGYLGERRSSNQIENFTFLVQDLCERVPMAAVNRGAFYLRKGAGHTQYYPSRNAFYEEIIWLLWSLRESARD